MRNNTEKALNAKTKDSISKKEAINRFFDKNKNLYKELKPSKKEIENLKSFERAVLVDNGLKNINGGFSNITIYRGDDEEFILEAECGSQDDTGGNKSYWSCRYDRKTEKFEEI